MPDVTYTIASGEILIPSPCPALVPDPKTGYTPASLYKNHSVTFLTRLGTTFAPVTAWFSATFGPVFAWLSATFAPVSAWFSAIFAWFGAIFAAISAWFSSIFAPVSAWFSNLFGSDNNEVEKEADNNEVEKEAERMEEVKRVENGVTSGGRKKKKN